MIINISTIIGTCVGALLGALIGALVLKNRANALKINLENTQRQLEETKAEAQADLEASDSRWSARLSEVKADEQKHYEEALAAKDKANDEAMQALKEHYDKSIQAQQERFDDTMSKIAEQNKAATEDMLKARQREFEESSSTNIGQIVNPLKETIAKMEEAMLKSSKEAISMNSSMKENLDQMIRQSQAAQATTEELTRAFKHQSKVQGDWGETVLTELLTSQGLEEGTHFDTQATLRDAKGNTIKSEEGSFMRPDVILHLDQKRDVIIDSKVSLTAFFDYVNAENEADRQQNLKAHVESLQKHVKELGKKSYSSYIQPPKVGMDYVIMFVPHTGALWTALNAQPDLWRKAMEQNVFIADEQTLYAALKIINMTWTQIKQAQNHEEVFKLANEMIDRVGQFVNKYEEVGTALTKAQEAYVDGKKKLEDRGHSILVSANKLIKLGAKSSKNPLPPMLDVDNV
jgi:DNA recombination protein RmuC